MSIDFSLHYYGFSIQLTKSLFFQIGDQVGYQDLDSQRKSERNYKFSFDESSLTIKDDHKADEHKNGEERHEKVEEHKEEEKEN